MCQDLIPYPGSILSTLTDMSFEYWREINNELIKVIERKTESIIKVQDTRQEYCNHPDTCKNAKWFGGGKKTRSLERVQTLSSGTWAVAWGPVRWSCDTLLFPPTHFCWPSPLQPLPRCLSHPGLWLQPTGVCAGGFYSCNFKLDLKPLERGSLGYVCKKEQALGQLLLTKIRAPSVSEQQSTTGPEWLPISFIPQSWR